jgi:hypothetical protein
LPQRRTAGPAGGEGLGFEGTAGVQILRYPPGTLIGDYLRAGVGVGVGVGVLASNPAGWALGLIFGGVTGVFGLFGARTAGRHLSKVGVSREELACAAVRTRRIPWNAVDKVRLRYYGTKRQERQHGGFFQLRVEGAGARMTFESNLESFDFLVWLAAEAARENGVGVDPTTAGNMLTLGIDPDGEERPPQHVLDLARRLEVGDGPPPPTTGAGDSSRRSA